MTTNTDINNEILVSELDRGSFTIKPPTNPSTDHPQMQVARKESSSGFMLLSVRHTSNIGNITTASGREMYPLEENYEDNYVGVASLQAGSNTVIDNVQMGRHYSSTMSLEAEEYDNDEEDGEQHSESNPFTHQQQFIVRDPPSNYNHTQIPNMEQPTNSAQIVDGLRPLAVSNLAQVQAPLVGTPVQNTVVQSHNDIQPQKMSERVLSGMSNQPVLFQQDNLDVASGGNTDPSIVNSATQLHTGVPGSSQVPPSDPSGVASVAVAGPQVGFTSSYHAVSEVSAQPHIQNIIDEINTESARSISGPPHPNSLLTSLNAQTQPASRFRKARIHETVEQWSSNRLSLHDRRLKAVPDWVSYMQSKPIDTSFNCPVAQRGRCLYCFVPGGFGSHCNNPKHSQTYSRVGPASKYQKNASLPTVPETSELSQILQATFTAYRAASQQGYNVSTLLSKWNSGERVSSRALLEQVDQSILSKNNLGLKANASEPALISTSHLEIAGHNSSDVNSVLLLGSEDFCNEGLTIVAQPTVQSHHPSELATVLEKPKAPLPHSVSPSQLNPTEASDIRVTDPSAAYLRHHITLGSEEVEAACSDGTPSSYMQFQPSKTLAIDPSGQRLVAPPPTSPTLAPTANHLQPAGANQLVVEGTAAISPSFSGTAAPSVQLSPDVEIAGMAVPRGLDPSSAGSSCVTTSGHKIATMLAAAGSMESENGASQILAENAAARAVAAAKAAAMAPSPSTSNAAGLTTMDFTAAARNLLEAAEVVANACASGTGQKSVPQPSSGVTPATNSSSSTSATTTTTTSITDNREAPVPKCMDVIREAIMDTLRDHYAQLSSEIEILRAKVDSLQKENFHLRNYKQAFVGLRPFLPPDTWEQINQQLLAVEAAESAQQLRTSAQESPSAMSYPQEQTQQQQQQQHFFPTASSSSTVVQQLNSAFQAQQEQPQQQHLSPSHKPSQNTAPQ
ncbi:hypothetical protein Aperf_G00000093634 [Anoplocephala perfoliata]